MNQNITELIELFALMPSLSELDFGVMDLIHNSEILKALVHKALPDDPSCRSCLLPNLTFITFPNRSPFLYSLFVEFLSSRFLPSCCHRENCQVTRLRRVELEVGEGADSYPPELLFPLPSECRISLSDFEQLQQLKRMGLDLRLIRHREYVDFESYFVT